MNASIREKEKFEEFKRDFCNIFRDRYSSLSLSQINTIINFCYYDMKIDLSIEKHNYFLNKYFENWNYRNTLTNLDNFNENIEKGLIKLFFEDLNEFKISNVNLISGYDQDFINIVTNIDLEPSVYNFLNENLSKVNLRFIKKVLVLIDDFLNEIINHYSQSELFVSFNNQYNIFKNNYKYMYQYLTFFEFEYINNEYIEKENKKLKLEILELRSFVNDLIDIASKLPISYIDQINYLLTYHV